MKAVTRFAPSPTGKLHLGHAASALFAAARGTEGFILRIEDIDAARCRPEFEDAIYRDLTWLGLAWPQPVRRQSEHFADYRAALAKLEAEGLLYPCFCSRREIQEEINRAPAAPHGPEGALYPGTCKQLHAAQRADKIAQNIPYALRLDMEAALKRLSAPLFWHDHSKGRQQATPALLGDVVLARRDAPASYHLCVTVDDHRQGITLVTRGEDLFHASHLHRLLQHLLDLDTPEYHHHGLLLDHEGKRFAKRNNAVTLEYLRKTDRKTPADIRALVAQAGIL